MGVRCSWAEGRSTSGREEWRREGGDSAAGAALQQVPTDARFLAHGVAPTLTPQAISPEGVSRLDTAGVAN